MERAYSIVLVEDHVIVRNGFKELLQHMGNYKVTGEFDHGGQLIEKIHEITPDVIIMDLTMPVLDGQATMAWMKKNKIDIPVLILTLDTSDNAIIELFRSGVRGYLSKTCTAETLKKAVEDIINTGYYHNELLSKALMKNGPKSVQQERDEILSQFTDKELDFLHLVCDKEEYTYERIGSIMGVHRRTVDNYRESLFRKFDIKSKTGLVLFAIKYGLISI